MGTDNDFIYNQSETDIVQLISKYVVLHPSRKTFKGGCPFHKDEAASFMVSPDKNIFKCFGCGTEGGPIDFMMAIQGITRDKAISSLNESI